MPQAKWSFFRTKTIARPYFRDWSSLNVNSGKTFLAPPTIFKAAAALYFPNIRGYTLADRRWKAYRDTTDTLEGKVSIIGIYSGLWAERQVRSWMDFGDGEETTQKDMNNLLGRHSALQVQDQSRLTPSTPPLIPIQTIDVNVETSRLRSALVYLFTTSLRRQRPTSDWGNYFIARKGLTRDIQEQMGYMNSKAGYICLVDSECRIRWAGSGEASSEERHKLLGSIRRLLTWEKEKELRTRERKSVKDKQFDTAQTHVPTNSEQKEEQRCPTTSIAAIA